MPTCPFCQRRLQPLAGHAAGPCPYCGETLPDKTTAPRLVSVARLTNLAEVGYFADLLAGEGIEAIVHQRDDFDAISARWEKTFVLQVDEERAEEAVAFLEQESRSAGGDEAGALDYDPLDVAAGGASLWKPVVLALMAGGLAYWGSRGVLNHVPRADPGRGRPLLWEALAEIEGPLYTPGGAGRARYELRYDRQLGRLLLDEDINGDGRFDRQRAFRRGRLVYDGPAR